MIRTKIQAIREYILSFLNEKINCKSLSSEQNKRLPFALRDKYKCTTTTLFGVDIVLCFPIEATSLTPARIQNHMQLFSNNLGIPCIIVLDEIPSYNIKRLIVQHVNFIITDKQMFVPSLLLDLRKIPKTNKDIKKEIPPFAQCLILYNLEVDIICHTIDEIMNMFNVSYSTVNRAVRWLEDKKLLYGSKRIHFIKHGRELWESSIIYLTSPIEKIIYSNTIPPNALSTNINSDNLSKNLDQNNCYAIYKKDMNDIVVSENGKFKIEIWKYNPKSLSGLKKHVDSLSYFLSNREKEEYEDIEKLLK